MRQSIRASLERASEYVPLAYVAIIIAGASLIRMLLELDWVITTLPPPEAPSYSRSGGAIGVIFRLAPWVAVLLGVTAAVRDEDQRTAGLVGAGMGLVTLMGWAVARAILWMIHSWVS